MKISSLYILPLVLSFCIKQANAQHSYKVAFLTAYYSYQAKDSLFTDTIGINYWETDSTQLNKILFKYSSTLQALIIENASQVIGNIDVHSIPHLHKLLMYGNDMCTDQLSSMRDDILLLPELKEVIFDGEGLPVQEFERIKSDYPLINFSGDICDWKK